MRAWSSHGSWVEESLDPFRWVDLMTSSQLKLVNDSFMLINISDGQIVGPPQKISTASFAKSSWIDRARIHENTH